MQCNAVQYNTIQYNTLQYNTMLYNTIQYFTMQYNTLQWGNPCLQYNICFISISNSVSDGVTYQSVLNIESS